MNKNQYKGLKDKIFTKLKKDNNIYYIIVVVVALLICIPLFAKGFFITHDGAAHLSRNFGTIEGIKDGQILPIIVPNFCNGFGYSWNLFYPPLSTYINALFYLLVPNYFISMKLVLIFSIICAGIFMFQFIKNVTKNKQMSLLVSILYITSIYFLTDIYMRLAIGEIMVYMFLPLLFWGLYGIFYEKGKKNYLLTIGAVGILLSHNISSLIVAILSIIIVLLHWKKLWKSEDRAQIWKNLLMNAVFIILIVLFFMIPLLEHKLATQYIAMTNEGMTSKELVTGASINLKQLIQTIGIVIFIPLLFTPFCYKKIEKDKRYLYFSILGLGLITAFISTKWFPWSYMPNIFLLIQFPWRILLFSTFFLSIIAGINISICIIHNKSLRLYMIIFIAIVCGGICICKIINFNFNFDISYLYETNSIENIYSFSQQCTNYEYLPVKARTTYIQDRENKVVVLYGDAHIQNEKKVGTHMQFDVENNTEDSILELPYIYYLGYTIKLNEEEIEYKESDNGFISLCIPKGENGTIQVNYTGTKLSKITLMISFIGTIGFIAYSIKEEK